MKKSFAILLLVLTLLGVPSFARAADNLLIVFDASGSMLEKLGSEMRIDAAKNAVTDLLKTLDSSVKVGLRPYADVRKATQAEACVQTSLAIPFTSDRTSVENRVQSLEAVGSYTPTAYTLLQAKNDFKAGESNALILLTDGKETCGGDPAAAAQALCEAGIKTKTYVIGIDVDTEARTQLSNVAAKGCGKYFDAKDSASLASSLKSIQEAEKPIDKTNTDAQLGTAVRGGNGYDTAVTITPGKYHLDHHQKAGDFDYFKLEVKKDVPVTFKAIMGPKGVKYDPITNTFTEFSYNGKDDILSALQYADEDRAVVGTLAAFNQHSPQKEESAYTPLKDGYLYIIVGNPYTFLENMAMSKTALFSIEFGEDPNAIASANGNSQSTGADTSSSNEDSNPLSNAAPETQNATKNIKLYAIIGIAVLIFLILIGIIMKLATRKTATSATQAMNMNTMRPQQPTYNPVIPPTANTAPAPSPVMPPSSQNSSINQNGNSNV
jgi:Mg-chelatase subunit ChlD